MTGFPPRASRKATSYDWVQGHGDVARTLLRNPLKAAFLLLSNRSLMFFTSVTSNFVMFMLAVFGSSMLARACVFLEYIENRENSILDTQIKYYDTSPSM